MIPREPLRVAIVDYGLGNLFSVKHACEHVGLDATVTGDRAAILSADAVLLPGVGAFGDAIECLNKLDLVEPLRDLAQSDTPLIGICLGLQLLMTESHEFGRHRGLDIVPGEVARFENPRGPRGPLKVPQIGWSQVRRPSTRPGGADPWHGTPMAGQRDGEYQYFVHSFYVKPADAAAVLCTSRYGDVEYCSAVRKGNVFAFQFHPERSGPAGLRVYETVASTVRKSKSAMEGRRYAA